MRKTKITYILSNIDKAIAFEWIADKFKKVRIIVKKLNEFLKLLIYSIKYAEIDYTTTKYSNYFNNLYLIVV